MGWSALVAILPRSGGRAGILVAAIGLIFHAAMMSVLSVDWILSAEPVFVSTSFGATIIVTQMLAALGFAALFARALDARASRDLGGLMLAVTLGVTYLNFMTVLVIWYGNLPTEVFWFVERLRAPWTEIAIASFVLGAMLPILSLLLEQVRASRMALRWVAGSSLAGIGLYDAWLLAPAYGPEALGTALLAAIAMASTFFAFILAGWPAGRFERARTAP
jgi:hypothetical protein